MESILTSIKQLLGVTAEDTSFDDDIIMGINTALSVLYQIGIGPSTGFAIHDDIPTWDDYLGDTTKIEMVKTYIHLRVKLVFDPPQNSSVLEMMKEQIKEFQWRLNDEAELKRKDGGET